MSLKNEILKLRGQGLTYTEISSRLSCAKSTISYHCNKGKRRTTGVTLKQRGISEKSVVDFYIKNGFNKTKAKFNLTNNTVSRVTKPHTHIKNNKVSNRNLTLGQLKRHCDKLESSTLKVGIYIRKMCRQWNSHLQKLPCLNCGYSHHVELCHLRGLKDFPDSVTMGEINHIDNVVQLCRNCHWELHEGLITINGRVV